MQLADSFNTIDLDGLHFVQVSSRRRRIALVVIMRAAQPCWRSKKAWSSQKLLACCRSADRVSPANSSRVSMVNFAVVVDMGYGSDVECCFQL